MRQLYTLLLFLLLPAEILRVAWRSLKNVEYLHSLPNRFGFVPPAGGRPGPVWIHAVSVGEVMAARALVDALLSREPRRVIVVSTTTPTGAAAARRHFDASIRHLYFPYDLPGVIERVMSRLSPSAVILMETEIWPNLLHACRRRDVPVALVNARLTERGLRRYRLAGTLIRAAVRSLSLICVQSADHSRRFVELGADPARVVVCGNLKFDSPLGVAGPRLESSARPPETAGRPVWIAASTHAGEETEVLNAFAVVRKSLPDTLLILVPRHPERFERVTGLCRQSGFAVQRQTHGGPIARETGIFLLDTVGDLQEFYAWADVAFVGGSLVRVGGHNLLEPARLGVPLISGPELAHFSEISALLREVAALEIVENSAQLSDTVIRLLRDPARRLAMAAAARDVCARNQGSADRVLLRLEPMLG